jgi:hypothetical protein
MTFADTSYFLALLNLDDKWLLATGPIRNGR